MTTTDVHIQLSTAPAEPAKIYLVEAITYGEVEATAAFLDVKEAQEFLDECTAFEATRYTEDEADAAGIYGYRALREDFDARHPWKRFSRGVHFEPETQMLGRPVKARA